MQIVNGLQQMAQEFIMFQILVIVQFFILHLKIRRYLRILSTMFRLMSRQEKFILQQKKVLFLTMEMFLRKQQILVMQ